MIHDVGAARLVKQACRAGVETFIFLSSIAAVYGNARERIVDDTTEPCPHFPYGQSKLAAEAHVAAFATGGRTGISVRPPLVYGAAAISNWNLLQKLAATGLPLPFGSPHNDLS